MLEVKLMQEEEQLAAVGLVEERIDRSEKNGILLLAKG